MHVHNCMENLKSEKCCLLFCVAFDDYLPISTNLTFDPFQVFKSVPLNIINNEFAEGVEQFSIRLLSYEDEIRIHGDLFVTVTDNRGKQRVYANI